ncbi:STM3941 family protein [Metabacillus fastidiosus]|uniref:STM3941 family protein n=1 Tax=Metabacillus fastidiosus TaxID=1458 RepID=UPI002E201D64|nr:hypothetical protein [Metabacillus fastidiosus]
MNDFVIMLKTRKIIMLSFLSIMFLLLGFLLIILTWGENMIFPQVLGVLIVLIFGFCLIYYVKVLVAKEPALVISNEGITDNSSYIGAGLVKWNEIENIDFFEMSGQLFLGISTYDRDLIINRMSGMKRIFNRMNKGLLNTQVNIAVKNLDCPIDELVEVINNRWQGAMEKNK